MPSERGKHLLTNEYPVMVGVYPYEAQAKSAITKLENAGFGDNQIGMVMRKGDLMPNHILDDLLNIGVREEEASLYANEFESGHIIVLVRHDGRLQEAFNCLYSLVITDMSITKEPEDRVEASQDASSISSSDEIAGLWKLLKDAGLDHLL